MYSSRGGKTSCGATFCLGVRGDLAWSGVGLGGGGAAHQGLPVLLFLDEEAGSHTRDKQRAGCPRATKHRAPVLQIFPRSRRVTSRLDSLALVSDDAPRSRIVRRVTRRPSIQKRPRPIGAGGGLSDTDCGDPSCRELFAATCLFWSVPLQRGDSERWGTAARSGEAGAELRATHRGPSSELHLGAGKVWAQRGGGVAVVGEEGEEGRAGLLIADPKV